MRKGRILLPVCAILASVLIAAGVVAWRVMSASSVRTADSGTVQIATSSTDVLRAIRQLESTHDPKCHSTACRFEDFIYGTPLEVEAREAKIALQKTLIRHIWRDAARHATAGGRAEIGEDDVQSVSEQIVSTSRGNLKNQLWMLTSLAEA